MRNEFVRSTKGWVPGTKISVGQIVTEYVANSQPGLPEPAQCAAERAGGCQGLGETSEAGTWNLLCYPLTKLLEFVEERKSPAASGGCWGSTATRRKGLGCKGRGRLESTKNSRGTTHAVGKETGAEAMHRVGK